MFLLRKQTLYRGATRKTGGLNCNRTSLELSGGFLIIPTRRLLLEYLLLGTMV